MQAPETLRHLIAGGASAIAFVGLYFGASLLALISLAGALLVYVAALLIVGRKPPPAERMLVDGVSEADLSTALAAMAEAAARLRRLEATAPAADRGAFERLAGLIERIRAHHEEDPRDLRHTRRFIVHDLPRVVETSENYVALSSRAAGAQAATIDERLAKLSSVIHGFAPVLERIDAACLENDFMKLEVEAEVFSSQLQYR